VSYDDTLATDLDRVRSILGDTDDTNELHSDEHIEAVLSARGSLPLAVSYLAHELVVWFEQEPVTFRDVAGEKNFSERLTTWRLLAAPYTAEITAQATAAAYAANTTASPLSFVPATFTGSEATDEYGRSCRWS
jgi:hypothetical protein